MRVLVFFPHNPFPPRSGAHRRCIEMLAGLRELGHTVTLASSEYTTETKWHSIAEHDYIAAGRPRLEIHTPTRGDWRFNHYAQLAQRYLPRRQPLSSRQYILPSMPLWFERLAETTQAEFVLNSYAFYDKLVSARLHTRQRCAIDMYDFATQFQPRRIALENALPPPPFSPEQIDPTLLDETFLDAIGSEPSAEEYAIYNKYADTIAITPQDGALVQKHAPQTRVAVIPMTFPIPNIANTYDGAALFTTGPNPFNVQGYLYFAGRVLPQIRAHAPDFQVDVTGHVAALVEPTANVNLRHYVPDLTPLFSVAPFLLCPILAKTGQLIKIPEAMAHGVPVIATARAAEGSPIIHRENGLVAATPAEFAAYVTELWNDRALCRRLGNAARETMRENFSRAQLLAKLAPLLHGARVHK